MLHNIICCCLQFYMSLVVDIATFNLWKASKRKFRLVLIWPFKKKYQKVILLVQFKDFPGYFFPGYGFQHAFMCPVLSFSLLAFRFDLFVDHCNICFLNWFYAHLFDLLGSIKNIKTGLYLTSLYPRPFVFQVKSDVRRLKGIPALVSMLDIPNKEVRFCLFSPHLSVHSLLDVCYYRWGELGGVKERLKGCSVFLT